MSQKLDYDQYDYYCCIYLDHNLINLSFGSNLNQQVEVSFALSHFERYPAAFSYSKHTGEIIDWGHAAEETFEALQDFTDNQIAEATLESSRSFHRSILAEIYRLYKNQDNNKGVDHQDEIRFKAIGKFLGAICTQAYKNSASQLSNSQFVFIVPTEWDHDIRAHFLLRLFQGAGIISAEDTGNRIIFTSVLEATVAALQEERYFKEYRIQFQREEIYLHCDLYLYDLESSTELILQVFKIEDEQTLTNSTTLSERTRRLLIPRLANIHSQDPIKLTSCKSVTLEFNSRASSLMTCVPEDWKGRLQTCLEGTKSFDEKEVDGEGLDTHFEIASANASCAKLIRHTSATKGETLFTVINGYLKSNNHRQVSSIILTLHDNLPQSQRSSSDLYFYCLAENLRLFQHAKIQILGESRWAFPKFGGPEIIRGGLLKLLEWLKFSNTEGAPTIDMIHAEYVSNHIKSKANKSDSPFVCGYRGCNWAFVDPHYAEDHRRVHSQAKFLIPTPTFWNPRIPRKSIFTAHDDEPTSGNPRIPRQQNHTEDDGQYLLLFMDITMESTYISLNVFDKQHKAYRKISLANSWLRGLVFQHIHQDLTILNGVFSLPPLSHFISVSLKENDRMVLTAKKIFFDLVNNLYHQAFHEFCNDNDNGDPRIHDLGSFHREFKFDHFFQYFAKSDIAWSPKAKNDNRVNELEEILYYNRSSESSEHTTANSLHVITFILLYIGFVYHKIGMMLEQPKKDLLQDVNLNSGTKVMLVLQDALLNILPLDALKDHEIRLKLCGLRGRSSEASSSKSDFATSMLQQSLSKKNDEPFIRSYYVHAKISEDNVKFKLNQILQSTTMHDTRMMPLLLKEQINNINQADDSIIRKIWDHIWRRQANQLRKADRLHSMNTVSYLSFKSRITEHISKILRFSKHAQKTRGGVGAFYDKKYHFEYHSDCELIALSLREIVEVAVRPSMRNVATSILSVLQNIDAFALYNAEFLLITGELLSPYYSYDLRALVSSVLKKEILESVRSSNLDLDVKFSLEPTTTDLSIESLDKMASVFKHCLEKTQISTRSKHNYALKFNFAQDLSVEDDGDEQQAMLECSSNKSTKIPANYLYVLMTQRTKVHQFSRCFKAESNNAADLENIELVKFEESEQVAANPGDSILGLSVPYSIVHRFGLEKMHDLRLQDIPLILSVAPLYYLSLLEIGLDAGNTDKAITPSLLREKLTISYEYPRME